MDGSIDPDGVRAVIHAVGEIALHVRVAAVFILGAMVFVILSMN
jgi:hypothetical protein